MKIGAIVYDPSHRTLEYMEGRSDEDSVVTPVEDVFNLQNADHLGMVLVSVPLIENSFPPLE